jgi:hypothetical protein
MNYKRHKPKLHWIISCCRDEAYKDHSNIPLRWSVNTRRSVGYNTDVRKEVQNYYNEQ